MIGIGQRASIRESSGKQGDNSSKLESFVEEELQLEADWPGSIQGLLSA